MDIPNAANTNHDRIVFSLRQQILSEWPRRLLYVPDMYSFERQPGNVYGDVAEPRYNILSYTWGRWQVPYGRVEPLHVNGISWKIPSVDPNIFTAQQLASVLRHVAHEVDWIWLDVACIDQEDPLIGDDEIGRQAGIFGNAEQAFIWLHHSPFAQLQSLVDSLFDVADRAEADQLGVAKSEDEDVPVRWSKGYIFTPNAVTDERWAEDVMSTLSLLDQDPWFSSLWTLQESFLRGDATVLSKEGHQLKRIGYSVVSLASLTTAWGQIHEAVERTLKNDIRHVTLEQSQRLRAIKVQIDRLGLSAGDNPAVLYSTAGHRKTTREEDRIYGIMQVFGFRLGKSANPGVHYSLPDLEVQFADALNAKSPIWAQLFIHKERPAPGQHWCISQSSYVPGSLAFCDIAPQSQCTISLSAGQKPIFKGHACHFLPMAQAWQQARHQARRPNFWGSENEDGSLPLEMIALDTNEFTEAEIPEGLRRVDNELDDTNEHLRDYLMKGHGATLKLFLIGKLQIPDYDDDGDEQHDPQEDAWIAMLVRPLQHADETLWQRIGLAVWANFQALKTSQPIDWTFMAATLT
ncbi:MAG: hypothetical protein Q9220_003621 [cf. Caloplaca sp. 1 TL-2023]